MSHYDQVTIVGGGIIGLSIAWELAKRGFSVRVIDARRIGRGASWSAAGILPTVARDVNFATEPIDQLRALSHRLYPAWVDELKHDSQVDPQLQRCGGLYLARSIGERATMLAQEALWNEYKVEFYRWLPTEVARHVSPLRLGHSFDNAMGWFLPDEYSVRPPRLLKSLIAACTNRGVEFLEDCEVTDVNVADKSVQLETTKFGRLNCNLLCITSGAWSQRLLGQLEVTTGIMPIRGQMLLYQFDHVPLSMVVNEGLRYIVPRLDGQVLIGSCEEEVGFDCRTDEKQLQSLREWANDLLPSFSGAVEVTSWAGLRPGSFDGLPYLGRLPNSKNVIVASGHYRSGIHLAPATAQIVAKLIVDEELPMDIRPFHVNRGQTASGYWNHHSIEAVR